MKNKAVFLDRDGVINRPIIRDGKPFPPTSVEEFEILPGVAEACVRLKAAGFLLIVATNQPDVGRGTLARETVEDIHAKMCAAIPLNDIEVCYDGGAAHGQPSEFRKPAPGMLLRAARVLGIDLAESWMVGDRWRDIDCGAAAGCRTVFIDLGHAEELRAKPDFVVRDLGDAAAVILGRCERHQTSAAPADINPRVAATLIASTGCILALVIHEAGQLLPHVFPRFLHDSLRRTSEVIPAPTRFAVAHLWIFIAPLVATSAYFFARLRRRPEKSLEIVAKALSVQGLIAWIAMFCFCYSGFEDLMRKHHDSEFDSERFLSFAVGFFPITLLLIAAPTVAVFFGQTKASQKSAVPPLTE